MDKEHKKGIIKGGLSCLGCLGVIFCLLLLIIFFDKPISPEAETPKQNKKESIRLNNIPYDETDIIYLEKYISQYITESKLQTYEYSYYINSKTWIDIPYKGKETLMVRCAAYGAIKTNQMSDNTNVAMSKVHILDNKNGNELGSYGIKGYKFK